LQPLTLNYDSMTKEQIRTLIKKHKKAARESLQEGYPQISAEHENIAHRLANIRR